MRRRHLLAGAAAALLAGPALGEDVAGKRVGYLSSQKADDPSLPILRDAALRGLAELGWVDGRNVAITFRYAGADPERIRDAAAELVEMHPDALFATTTPPSLALRSLTSTIPIVFGNISDPVGSGFVETFSHPGMNMTGCTNYEDTVASKWLDLLLQLAPGTETVGLMFNPDTAPHAGAFYWNPFAAAAEVRKVKGVRVVAHSPDEIDQSVGQLAREPHPALVVSSDIFTYVNRVRIVAAVANQRLPAIYPYSEFSQAGGLLSYAVDLPDNYYRAGQLLGRILNGESPSDLPVQGPSRFITTLDLATARVQGIAIPPDLLATATQVIE
jgi:putative ABC transport system substrate-binding protein